MKQNRRDLLKALTLGGGAVTVTKLPAQWTTPVVDSVVLPAHAQTTGPTTPGIVNAGAVGSTEFIGGANTPGLLDVFGQPAHALPATYLVSVCIVVDLALSLYDAFVIVNDETINFPSYRGTGLPLDPANETDSNLVFDGDCGGNTSVLEPVVGTAHANGLGVQIRVFDVQTNGATVEVEVEMSRFTTFVEWNDFGCGLSCGGLPLPELVPSDRHIKAGFEAVDEQEILDRVAAMPVAYWNYTDRDPGVRHIGPMAQDFHAAFNVGDSDRHIHMVDANGVNLASIKALYKRLEERDAKISRLEEELRLIKETLGLA